MNLINIIANEMKNKYLKCTYYEFAQLAKIKDCKNNILVKDFIKTAHGLLLISMLSKISNNAQRLLPQISNLTMIQIFALGVICYNP